MATTRMGPGDVYDFMRFFIYDKKIFQQKHSAVKPQMFTLVTKKEMTVKKLLILSFLFVTICTPSAFAQNNDKLTPSVLCEKIVKSVSIPEKHTRLLSNVKKEIELWQVEAMAKKTDMGVGIFENNDFSLSALLTVDVVEKALGKPDKKTSGKIPSMWDSKTGKQLEGPVLWYGEIGFGFARLGGNECLFMIRTTNTKERVE